MTIEAMKQALAALERMKGYGDVFQYRSDQQNPYDQLCEAITALRAAIEQAEQPRQWQGLTDEDKDGFWRADQMSHEEWEELFAAIEAKLKEKNT